MAPRTRRLHALLPMVAVFAFFGGTACQDPASAGTCGGESDLTEDAKLSPLAVSPLAACRLAPVNQLQHQLSCAGAAAGAQEVPLASAIDKITIVAVSSTRQSRTWSSALAVGMLSREVPLAVGDGDLPVTVTTTAKLNGSIARVLGVGELTETQIISTRTTAVRTIRLPFEFLRVRVLLGAGQRVHVAGKQTLPLGSWTAGSASSLDVSLSREGSAGAGEPYAQIPVFAAPKAQPIDASLSLDGAAEVPLKITGAGYYLVTGIAARLATREEVAKSGVSPSDRVEVDSPVKIAEKFAEICTKLAAACPLDGVACTTALEEKPYATLQIFSDCLGKASDCPGVAACVEAAKNAL